MEARASKAAREFAQATGTERERGEIDRGEIDRGEIDREGVEGEG